MEAFAVSIYNFNIEQQLSMAVVRVRRTALEDSNLQLHKSERLLQSRRSQCRPQIIKA